MDLRRLCCCGDQPTFGDVSCGGTVTWRRCTETAVPPAGARWWNSTETRDTTESIAALAIEATGIYSNVFKFLRTGFPDSVEDITVDAKIWDGVYVQWGRHATDDEWHALATVPQPGDIVNVARNEPTDLADPLFVTSYRIVRGTRISNGVQTDGENPVGVNVGVGFGGGVNGIPASISAVVSMTPNVPLSFLIGCVPNQQRTIPIGFNATQTETVERALQATNRGFNDTASRVKVTTSPSAQQTEDRQYSNQVNVSVTLGPNDTPPGWAGPSGYSVCNALAEAARRMGNPNARAIEAALMNDPLRTCRGCGQ